MQHPPRDAIGVVPHDHPEIQANDQMVRYLRVGFNVFWVDGKWDVSSGAFSPSSEPGGDRSSVSVDSESSMRLAGLGEPFRLRTPNDAFARLSVAAIREFGLKVGWDPLDDNPHHCGIWGVKNKSIRRKLAALAKTVGANSAG